MEEKPEPSAWQDVILDSINEGVFTVDLDWRITSFNRAAERITGVKRQDALGHACSEVFRASICEDSCVLRTTLSTGKSSPNTTVYVVDARGERIPIKISAAVLRDQQGRVIGGVETFHDMRQLEELRKQLQAKHSLEDIVGRSPAMTQLFELLRQVADSDSTVLLDGASGTGKELFAQAIHNLSSRKERRFVAVNCGALPDTLLESELFGYLAGAFTDARRDKPGRFALADGGTLFLDEIGDVSPAMQVRLLRVLEERSFEPLGSLEPTHTDVRLVAATNKNLDKLVADGSFRDDLYYRINVVRLAIPSLRDRREDIPLLCERFVEKFNRLQDSNVTGVSREVLAVLMEHDFPGNVRELQNVIEHAFVLCSAGPIELQHLPPYLRRMPAGELLGGEQNLDLRSMERMLIAEVLRKHAGNRALAARELGIDPSTLYRKIKALGVQAPATDGRGRVGKATFPRG